MKMPSPNCSIAGSQSGSAERRAAYRKTDVLEVIARQRRRLEPREAVKTGDLAEPMDSDKRQMLDSSGSVRVPDGARQGLGVQMRVRAVGANQRSPAREQLKFGDLRVFGLVGACAAGGHR